MLERELKFSPGPSFVLPDLADPELGLVADEPVTAKLVAAYFDTADLRLSRSGASLRHRNDEGWMVKLPVARGDGLVRHEHRVPGEGDEPPREAVALVLAIARSCPLELVARINTVRRRVVVRDGEGRQVAEVADDEVSVIDGVRLTARFRELEVELAEDADDDVAAALAQRLQTAGAGPPDPVPKIVRAIGPRALDPSDVASPSKLDLASTPHEVLTAAVARSVARLVEHDPGVRIGDDEESVHQARVATRRLRSDLRTFRTTIDADWSEPLREELKWLGERLGGVRDPDVLLGRLEATLDALPHADADGAHELLDTLRGERDSARDELLVAMSSDRYLALLDRLVEATHGVPAAADTDDADDVELEALVRRPWKRLRDAVDALDDDPPDEALHEVRIRAKRARYAAEAVAPAVGSDARRFAKQITDLQDVLGEHQDSVVAEHWLRERLGTPASGSMLFVAGELAAVERAAGRAARSRFPQVWRRARRKHLRVAVTRDLVRAAGGVVWRRDRDGKGPLRILLVHRPRYDDWSLPKGKAESGEKPEETALREVHEETGLQCRLGREVESTRYRDSRGRRKEVRYWLMEPTSDTEFEVNDEVDEVRWCSPADALSMLSYDHDQRLVASVSEELQ